MRRAGAGITAVILAIAPARAPREPRSCSVRATRASCCTPAAAALRQPAKSCGIGFWLQLRGSGSLGLYFFYCWGRITTFAFRIGSCRGATAAVVWKAPEAGPWGGDRGLSHAAPWWRHFSAPQPSQSAAASGARLQLKRD